MACRIGDRERNSARIERKPLAAAEKPKVVVP